MRTAVPKVNRLINKAEIVLGKETLLSYPQDIQIEPTNRCNQRCIMCARNAGLDASTGDMSLGNFKKIIDKLPTIRNLLLNGLGEPLLNQDLPEMIKFADSKGITVSINSNCALIDGALAKRLADSGLHLIKISMDSSEPEVYRAIRGANIEPTILGIKNLVRARKEKGSSFPLLWFNSIIMKENYKKLIDILKLGEFLEIDLVRFKPVNVFDLEQNKSLVVRAEELKKAIQETIQSAENLKIRHNLPQLLNNFDIYYRPKEKTPCYSPWRELYVQHYGGVRLCCEFYSKKYDIGNILEEDFRQIWNGARMRQIRKEFKGGNTYFPVCRNCNRFQKNILTSRKINRVRNLWFANLFKTGRHKD